MTAQAVAKREEAALPAATEVTAFLAMIERAARDPAVDVDKMERLLAMQEKVIARQAKAAFTAALVKMKPLLPVIDRKGRIEIREKDNQGKRTGAIQQSTGYARWEDIDEAITPILHDHGFALTFRSSSSSDGRLVVTAVLEHEAGHSEQTETPPLPHDSSGSKNPVQAVGSSLSYGKRIAATLLLNIRTKGEDDDGVKAGAGPVITDAQAGKIMDALEAKGASRATFLKWAQVSKIEDIPADLYDSCIDAINQYKPKAKA